MEITLKRTTFEDILQVITSGSNARKKMSKVLGRRHPYLSVRQLLHSQFAYWTDGPHAVPRLLHEDVASSAAILDTVKVFISEH